MINDINTKSSNILNQGTKRFAYLLLATLIGLVLIIEDTLTDTSVIHVLVEFVILVPLLTILFISFGFLANKCIHYWRTIALSRLGVYTDLVFALIWILCISFFMAVVSMIIADFLPIDDDGPGFFDSTWVAWWLVWVVGLLFASIILVVEYFWKVLTNRQQLELSIERLKRSQDLAKYQALIHQINPHFLFNSLNVLSMLVYKDPRDAERFIEELSKMYRYILQLNEAYLVPLQKELEFIESYIYLQKIRYQDNLQFHSKVSAHSLNQLIPPLTLEVLVENAIKHNAIGKDTPLHIELSTQNGHLILQNQLQPRMENNTPSTKVGLKNLLEKYTILESELPEFFTQNGQFIAKIPLLKPEL